MGEKELIVSIPTLARYIEGNKEALETSFQSLEVAGTTDAKPENPNPFRAEIMETWVLIKGGYQPDRGLDLHLNGIATPIFIQKNAGQSYKRSPETRNLDPSSMTSILGEYFVKGGILVIEDKPTNQQEWVYVTKEEPTN
ncbi:hypothetical protein CR513_29217, partial [Mucuna pruriens]